MSIDYPTDELERIIKVDSSGRLFDVLNEAVKETSADAVGVVRRMLQAAMDGEDLLVPSEQHPFLTPDGPGKYKIEPHPEDVPLKVEQAVRFLLDDPTRSRALWSVLRNFFVIIVNPYRGGIMIRGLQTIPGGQRKQV